MPRASPFTAHRSGLGKTVSWSMRPGKPCSPVWKLAGSVVRAAISTTSVPAEKARPVPVSTTTATSGELAASMSAWVAASYSASLNALRASGRLRVSTRTRPSSRTSITGSRAPAGADGERLVAAHEVGGAGGRFGDVDQLEVGQLLEQLLEQHAQLEAGQAGAQAEVGTEAERHVLVRRAADVERRSVGEHVLVAVGRRVEEEQLLALRDHLTAELGVGHGGAGHVLDGADPPQHLLDGGVEQAAVGDQRLPPLALAQQLVRTARDHVARGLVAADEDQERLHHDLGVVEAVAVDLGGGE